MVAEIHDEASAETASAEFVRRFQKKEQPADIPVKKLSAGSYALPNLLKDAGLAASTSEARRLIQGGGVRLDQEVVKDVRHQVELTADAGVLLQAGKRRFAQVEAE